MRHAQKRYQLNRNTSWRRATIDSIARSVLLNQSIRTTRTRAKAVKPLVEKLISLAKKDTLFARREANKILNDHQLVKMLFSDIGKRFSSRSSGFTRTIGLGRRRGDDADMVILELTEIKKKETVKPKKEKAAARAEPEKLKASEVKTPESSPEKTEKPEAVHQERPPATQKPQKKFLGGIKNMFRKERDAL